jgi:uncharacterized protein (TIGR03437 family)
MKNVLAIVAALCSASAQNMVVGAGNVAPAPIKVAPGQIVTLFVSGVGASLTGPVRAKGNGTLPASLAGISVTLRQCTDRAVPIVDVRPVSTCPSVPTRCGTLTAVTLQIPYDIVILCPLCGRPEVPGALVVSEKGVAGAAVDIVPLADQIHVLSTCDILSDNASFINTSSAPCPPVVTHADGTLVSALQPAKAGEQVVAYATGLGATNPPAATGQIVTTAAPIAQTLALNFNFAANGGATEPLPRPDVDTPTPAYAGIVPGYTGLYQINFVVPAPATGIPSCTDLTAIPQGVQVVRSNLTVTFGGAASFDAAPICVAP